MKSGDRTQYIHFNILSASWTQIFSRLVLSTVKAKFLKAEVDSLVDFVQVVEQSSAVKIAQPGGSSNENKRHQRLSTLRCKCNITGLVAARPIVCGPVTYFSLLKEDTSSNNGR
uniref:Uncharacterized protein n=1 Tax=Amphimedon queenslandica TaxID=400682 RepID=A0A1X7U3C2_AMPQE